ncbi:Hemolysin secretion protein D, plasmid [Burkholderiales bacterium]|nr:Hemolysin secretion protein D, plasmid [Burkholderiales bacterium]
MPGAVLMHRAGDEATTFAPGWQRIENTPASPGRRRLLHALLALLACAVAWTWLGRLDVVVVAEGRLAPRTQLRIVQPPDAGVVREVLVAEGASVLAGELLVRLDAVLAESETRALRAELQRRDLQLRRIDAELDAVPPDRRPDDAVDAHAAALALYHANRRAYLDAVAHETAAVDRLVQELAAARASERKLERVLPIVRSAAERYAGLRADGFVSELSALEREREHIEKTQDLAAQRHVVAGVEAALTQARRRLAQVSSAYRAQLRAERAQADGEFGRIGEALARQLHRAEQVELRAPSAGVVKDVATHSPGAVVGAGTPLVTLVPAGEELVADVIVRHEDAGFVRVGQASRVKLAAYPFQKYGTVDGRVVHVAADATEPARDRMPDAAPSGYRARIALDGQLLRNADLALVLASGMQVSAEIRLGERRVIEYLLSPLQKAWHEAARER